jgi:GPI transamidase subunit PIG-U
MQNSFWRLPSTWVVTAIRFSILLATQIGRSSFLPLVWCQSSSFTQILIRPSYTVSHVREALAIQRLSGGRFVGAYAAQRVRIPPLLLAACTPLVASKYAELYLGILCLCLDFLLAAMLQSLARIALLTNRLERVDKESLEQEQLPEAIQPCSRHVFGISVGSKDSKSLIPMESVPLLAAQLYYWSPVVVLSSAAYPCFQCLPGFLMIASFYEGVRPHGSLSFSSFLLAAATYLELHHAAVLVPLLALPVMRGRKPQVVFSFVFWFACLQGLSYQLVGPRDVIRVIQATYGMGWTTISPSLSVQWYLATQLFSRFRDYFATLLLGLPYIVVLPIAMRLYKYPMVLVSLDIVCY